MINTIRCASFNRQAREKLYAEYLAAQKKAEALRAEIYAIENNTEFEKREREAFEASEKVCEAYKKCFAAQFHRCNSCWFAKIVEELTENEYKPISEKQHYYFRQYASDTDETGWQDGKSYCRVGDYLITLVWHNSLRAIKKEKI